MYANVFVGVCVWCIGFVGGWGGGVVHWVIGRGGGSGALVGEGEVRE